MSSHGEHAAFEQADAVRDAFEGERAVEGLDPTAFVPEPEVPKHRRGLSPLGCASMLLVAGIAAAVVAGVQQERLEEEVVEHQSAAFERLAALQRGRGDQPSLLWAAEVCLRMDEPDCGVALEAVEALHVGACVRARDRFATLRLRFHYRQVAATRDRSMQTELDRCRD